MNECTLEDYLIITKTNIYLIKGVKYKFTNDNTVIFYDVTEFEPLMEFPKEEINNIVRLSGNVDDLYVTTKDDEMAEKTREMLNRYGVGNKDNHNETPIYKPHRFGRSGDYNNGE